MAIRRNLQQVIQMTDTGGVDTTYTFTVPIQDIHCLVFKQTATTLSGTSPTLDVYVQTTDDGGTTWYDCGVFKRITTSIAAGAEPWMVVTNLAGANRDGTNFGYAGVCTDASASPTAGTVTGLPLLSSLVRIKLDYGGTIGAANVGLKAYANTYDAR